MIEEETQHFPPGVRASRIGVGAGGTASRPGVADTVNIPMLGDGAPARVGDDRAGIRVPAGHPSTASLSGSPRRRTARQFARRCSDAPWCRGRRENDGRNGRSAIADLKPAPAAWRRTPKGSSLAATQARPEWIPTAAYRSHAPLPGWRQPPRPPTSLRRRRASDRSDSLVGVALPSALCTSTAVAASSEAARHSERVQARASVPLAQSLCLYSAALT
jgi:hypothetical protein